MVRLSRKANIAMNSLLSEDQRRVRERLRRIDQIPMSEFGDHGIRKLKSVEGPLFLARATPRLRVIFRMDEGNLEVDEIVTRDRLQRMHQYRHENA